MRPQESDFPVRLLSIVLPVKNPDSLAQKNTDFLLINRTKAAIIAALIEAEDGTSSGIEYLSPVARALLSAFSI